MNILFEEDGAFKAGTVLADNTTSLQVETSTGKRVKVKAANVLLRFAQPLRRANCSSAPRPKPKASSRVPLGSLRRDRIRFRGTGAGILAATYPQPGRIGGHPAAPACRADLLPPQGQGPLPQGAAEILKAALAGLEKKRQQALAIERMAANSSPARCPPSSSRLLQSLLYKPDRNRLETKALEAACAESGLSVPRLLACGAMPFHHDYHFERFLFEYFPQGTGFPRSTPPADPEDLPLACSAPSPSTMRHHRDRRCLLGHAAGRRRLAHRHPHRRAGLGIRPIPALGDIARKPAVHGVHAGQQDHHAARRGGRALHPGEGRDCPALSLYLEVGPRLRVTGNEAASNGAGGGQPAPPRHRAGVQRDDPGRGRPGLPLEAAS
jgi:exoribonuclease-2